MDLQSLMDAMSDGWRQERAETQMTIGKLIEYLESVQPDFLIDKFENPHSYRGYYSDLAFERVLGETMPAHEFLNMARKCMGEEFTGWKGGEYIMHKNTPIWNAQEGCCGMKIIGFETDGSSILKEDDY